ncbi:LOW QUALITY PROTEIN: antizyme inhibitor 2-like [Discoglossus pictus]
MAPIVEKQLIDNATETGKKGHSSRKDVHSVKRLNFMQGLNVTVLDEGTTVQQFVKQKIASENLTGERNAFNVADLGELVHKHRHFVQELPRVKPFYAVKCNNTRELLQTLVILGTGFDCASKGEIDMILDMGVPAEDIVYANPCKQPSHIRHAARHGVRKMTFDCESELMKVAENHPEAEMILRIRIDDSGSPCCFSRKFGVSLLRCEHLLQVAKSLNVEVIGVSFHIGSLSKDPYAFNTSIKDARQVFDIGETLGFKMPLDIGGGFPGRSYFKPRFEEFAAVIRESLDLYFPSDEDYEIIAEPGRYYATSVITSVVNITTKKEQETENNRKCFHYYLNDGTFGSFMECMLLDDAKLTPITEKDIDHVQPLFPSVLWGPSCTDDDEVMKDVALPELEVGDWIIFTEMGAYSVALQTNFNGFIPPPVHAVIRREILQLL